MKRTAFSVLFLSALAFFAVTSTAQEGKGKSKTRDARGGRDVPQERTRDAGKRVDQKERRARDGERGKDGARDATRGGVRDVRRVADKPENAGRAKDRGRGVVDGARGAERARDGARDAVREEVRDVRRTEDKPEHAERAQDKGRGVVDGARGQERALVEESIHHRERLARLEKLSEIFGSKSKDPAAEEKLGRVRKLREKEMARHGAAMERYQRTMGAARVEEILSRDTLTRGKRDTDRRDLRDAREEDGPRDGGEHAERDRDSKRPEHKRGRKDRDS